MLLKLSLYYLVRLHRLGEDTCEIDVVIDDLSIDAQVQESLALRVVTAWGLTVIVAMVLYEAAIGRILIFIDIFVAAALI